MLEVTAEGWAATLAVIFGLLFLDWVVLGRQPRMVGLVGAARWSLFYVAVSVAFGVVFGLLNGANLATQYFSGYLVELSLSVDNLFVFVIIIGSFAVPVAQQPKTLSIGIALALALRAVFIALGAALLQLFSFMFLIFGMALTITAIQPFCHRNRDPHIEDNLIVAWARRALPMSSVYEEGRIVTRSAGRRVLTPLFLALVAIGTTDLLFAFDSIPAVFGVTDHAYIVFAANAFALLGLRPLYFLVSGLLRRPGSTSEGAGTDPRLHRREAHSRVRPPAKSLDIRSADRGVTGGDRRGAGRDHDRERHQVETGSGQTSSCRRPQTRHRPGRDARRGPRSDAPASDGVKPIA